VAEKSVLAFEKILSSKDTAYIKFVNTRKSATGQIARIIIEAKNYNAKTENIRIFNNGAEIHAKETETLYNQEIGIVTKSYNINIQRGLNTITAFISDETGNKKSNEANYSIVGDYKLDKNPQLYAVVVGINHFKNNKDLKYAVPDASTFGTALYKHTNDIFSNVKLMYLREKKETTKFAIVKALKQLQNISPNDYFIFYVSSHGGIIDGVFYLACSDGAISHYELLELFKRIPTANKLLLFDTCQSGMINSEVSKKLFEYSQRKMNITSISAAQSHQAALEGYADGHGIFTYVLMDGLEGDADFNRDGIVQSIELVSYAKKHVPVAAARKFNHVQVPASFQAGQVFPVTKHKRNTGQVPLSTQYFKKEEVQKLLSYIEYNNIEKFNEAIEKKRIETENKIVELKIDAEQSEAGILENEFNYSKQNMTIDRIKFIFHDDSVFLGIADKIKDHYTFVDNKGNILLVVDIFSSEFTKHSVNYIDTSKVSKIDIGWHNSFYRVTLHLKKLSEYDLKKTDSGIFIKIHDKY
jgi:hypothetical protein